MREQYKTIHFSPELHALLGAAIARADEESARTVAASPPIDQADAKRKTISTPTFNPISAVLFEDRDVLQAHHLKLTPELSSELETLRADMFGSDDWYKRPCIVFR